MRIREILKKRESKVIIVDLLMMLILLVNLNLILFDWLFISKTVQNLLAHYTPVFYEWYKLNIHQDFLRVDLYFVAIFVSELLVRWGIAIKRRSYHRWFFYPFVNWCDTLGCLPVGSFRFLRVLRVVAIIVRLHKLEIIDITKSYLFQVFEKYLNVLVEEVSDRVVVNVLSGIQDEIRGGTPVTEQIIEDVLRPQQADLVAWLSQRIQRITNQAHQTYRENIRQYIAGLVNEAVKKNIEMRAIDLVPVMGSFVNSRLEHAISDIVFNVINGIIEDLASQQNKFLVDELTGLTFDTILKEESDQKINDIARDMIIDSLEIIKDQVKVQQWKLRELEEKKAQLEKRLGL